MKKIITLLFVCICYFTTYAQTPEKIGYQALVRDGNNELIKNQSVGVQVSILQGGISGSTIFTEEHSSTTNDFGFVSLNIGKGTPVVGSFDTINWGDATYYIKTEIDLTGGTNYTLTSTSELLSVPYALYAKTSGSSTPGPKGEQGIQGIQGEKGEQGIQGAQGEKGEKGDQGKQGVQGIQGEKGEQGIQGAQGEKGEKGAQGKQGEQGIQGEKGDQGKQGVQGIQGEKGEQGIQGEKGEKGDQGKQGIQGIQGEKGEKGDQGKQGVQGEKGDGANQNLSITNTTLTISDGNSIDLLNAIKAGEVDGSITNEIELPTGGNNGEVLKTDGSGNYEWVKVLTGKEDTKITGALEVEGAATNKKAYNAGASNIIDFTKSNLAYTSSNPTAFTLNGIKDGGTYTLAVQGGVSSEATFTATGFTFKSKNNSTTLDDTHTLYTFLVMGTTVYFSMVTGL